MRTQLAVIASSLALAAAPARAQPADPPWSADHPEIAERVRSTGTLAVQVVVPLCHNAQVDCAGPRAGAPADLDQNLYWGAVFGMRRFFDRKASKFERVSVDHDGQGLLERAIYRRSFDGAVWGRVAPVEVLVVFEAVHGDRIDEAVDRFWRNATAGSSVTFDDGGRARTVPIDVSGYAGHNRLMDGTRLPDSEPPATGALPSFVLACYSDAYFTDRLEAAGSEPLLMTRALIAPEAYVVEGLVEALGKNVPRRELRRAAVDKYASWQRIDYSVASGLFADVSP